MVKPIIKDIFFLRQKSVPATPGDKQVIMDLRDTLRENRNGCVGMAANMIGVLKRIIIVSTGYEDVIMVNPVIIKKSGRYETEEGCLSLSGMRRTDRYQNIEVEYLDSDFRNQKGKFSGWLAQIIQHEIDHCDGILI